MVIPGFFKARNNTEGLKVRGYETMGKKHSDVSYLIFS